ncbi:Octanoyltransferase [Arthrobotrys entomopaga]|nr:Octanoyltransferase [Arthrobotrys entomopaga]
MPPPLRHLRLPLTSYSHASYLQSILFNLHLLHKKSPLPFQPPAYVITAQFNPIYTYGRRESQTLPPASLLKLLTQPPPQKSNPNSKSHDDRVKEWVQPQLAYTPRGGSITFHGPGQIVAYPIISLPSHSLSPKCYIRTLETTIIEFLSKFDIPAFTTAEPGVWTRQDRKIASVGVNLRRYVTSHGFALNVDVDLAWFKHIVACGLEGVEMWSMAQELEAMQQRESKGDGEDIWSMIKLRIGAEGWWKLLEDAVVKRLAMGLGCDTIERMTEEEVLELGERFGVGKRDDVDVVSAERLEELVKSQQGT